MDDKIMSGGVLANALTAMLVGLLAANSRRLNVTTDKRSIRVYCTTNMDEARPKMS